MNRSAASIAGGRWGRDGRDGRHDARQPRAHRDAALVSALVALSVACGSDPTDTGAGEPAPDASSDASDGRDAAATNGPFDAARTVDGSAAVSDATSAPPPDSTGPVGAEAGSGLDATAPGAGGKDGAGDGASKDDADGPRDAAQAEAASDATGGPVLGGPYLFSTFFGDAAPLLIYTSTDALHFTLLSNTGYSGPTGTLRDPSIMRYSDGKYYVAFTTPPTAGCCGAETMFAIADSADLVHWTTLTTVHSGVAGTVNTWAPEWFKDADGSIDLLVSIDTAAANSFQTYRFTALDTTLTAWSGPTAIGIGPNHIDTFVVTVGPVYHAFTKNETTLFIEHATAASLNGPWTFTGTGDWAGWGTHREAPALIELPGGVWRIVMDGGSQGNELYSDSKDTFKTWTAPQTLPAIGTMVSHGTIIRETVSESITQ